MSALKSSLLCLLTSHDTAGTGYIGVTKVEETQEGEQTDPGDQGQAQHCQVCSSHANPHAIHMGAWA